MVFRDIAQKIEKTQSAHKEDFFKIQLYYGLEDF